MSNIKERLTKQAGVEKAIKAVSPKYRYAAAGLAGIAGYEGGKRGFKDWREGRRIRKSRQAQEKASRLMSKYASGRSLFNREQAGIFPLASESGAISARQSLLDGLFANKGKMGKMAQEQLVSNFPKSHHVGSVHGNRQRSMMTGKDAGSALRKAFK